MKKGPLMAVTDLVESDVNEMLSKASSAKSLVELKFECVVRHSDAKDETMKKVYLMKLFLTAETNLFNACATKGYLMPMVRLLELGSFKVSSKDEVAARAC
jgi:hypothetical protein